jgi:cystathionine beta-lyase family protein involved in aluminum resistance
LPEFIKNRFGIDAAVIKLTQSVESEIKDIFKDIDAVKELNLIQSDLGNAGTHLSDSHFSGTTGYGYDDRGREILDAVYALFSKRRMRLSGIRSLPVPRR